MAGDELVGGRGGDVVDGEQAVLLGDPRVEDHLHEDVAELLAQVVVRADLDRVDELGRLLDEMLDEGAVRLGGVPRAVGAQSVDHPHEPLELGAPRAGVAPVGPLPGGHQPSLRPDSEPEPMTVSSSASQAP